MLSIHCRTAFFLQVCPFAKDFCNYSQATHHEASSSSSSHSESEDDFPIAKLKRPPRKPILESSDEEDNIPLSELAKEAEPSQSSHDEDMDMEEEEEGDASDSEEPWGGVAEDDVLPPSLNLVWDGGKIVKCLIHQVEPGFGGVITAKTNGVDGITPRLLDMPLGGRTLGAASV